MVKPVPFQLTARVRGSLLLWFDASGVCFYGSSPTVQTNQDHFNEARHSEPSELAHSSHQGQFNVTWFQKANKYIHAQSIPKFVSNTAGQVR